MSKVYYKAVSGCVNREDNQGTFTVRPDIIINNDILYQFGLTDGVGSSVGDSFPVNLSYA